MARNILSEPKILFIFHFSHESRLPSAVIRFYRFASHKPQISERLPQSVLPDIRGHIVRSLLQL